MIVGVAHRSSGLLQVAQTAVLVTGVRSPRDYSGHRLEDCDQIESYVIVSRRKWKDHWF